MAPKLLSRFKLSMPGYFFCAAMLSAITLSTLALISEPTSFQNALARVITPPKLTPIITLFVEEAGPAAPADLTASEAVE